MAIAGVSTLFDPSEYGKPGNIAAPGDRRYSEFQTFDRSPMANRLINALSAKTGQTQAKALGAASKLGVGRSSGTAGMLQNIAAEGENQAGQIQAQGALDSWKDLVQQKEAAEAGDISKYQAQLGYKGKELEAAQRDKEAREQAFYKLLGAVGSFIPKV